ncbi:hypothetical protein SAMN05192564_102732 [Paraburkholderia sartisoli]|uniref:Uncharacterized protein n=1 Tax=Paraburkholderia sartisoli TaxID=83784 RepID=A0A1H4D916_9BURK|nr:hypothetical protein SAMN05192564_102732 [Paraburkholderia sartisoli]
MKDQAVVILHDEEVAAQIRTVGYVERSGPEPAIMPTKEP